MKKVLAMVLTVLMVFSIVGCGSQQSGASADTDLLASVLAEGKLVAAIEVGSEPFTFADVETGEYIGFNIDIMEGFCSAIGV